MEHFVIVREDQRYRRVVRSEEQYQYHMAPAPQEDPVKILLEHFGKQAERKANYKMHTYAIPPMTHKVHTYTIPHKGPNYPRTFAHQGHVEQPNMVNQAPPLKNHGRVMNHKDAAKIYGGEEFTKYYNCN